MSKQILFLLKAERSKDFITYYHDDTYQGYTNWGHWTPSPVVPNTLDDIQEAGEYTTDENKFWRESEFGEYMDAELVKSFSSFEEMKEWAATMPELFI